jgi:gas vesicle protein
MRMNHDPAIMSRINWILGGVALGAIAMFLLDPDKGRRRRALARDKMYSTAIRTGKRIDAKSRDLANRAKGLRAEASHMWSE